MRPKFGITRANRELHRWVRYARRCEKVAGDIRAPQGLCAAYNRYVVAYNRRSYHRQQVPGA